VTTLLFAHLARGPRASREALIGEELRSEIS
jgi:hypothetical protein